jgi:hypothetical protein
MNVASWNSGNMQLKFSKKSLNNVVLAISHRLRVMSNLVPHEEDKKAWLYLKNAMGRRDHASIAAPLSA